MPLLLFLVLTLAGLSGAAALFLGQTLVGALAVLFALIALIAPLCRLSKPSRHGSWTAGGHPGFSIHAPSPHEPRRP